jgi:hypothetical protein
VAVQLYSYKKQYWTASKRDFTARQERLYSCTVTKQLRKDSEQHIYAVHQVTGRKGRTANRKGWSAECRVQSAECSKKVKQGEQKWTDSEQVRQDSGWLRQDPRSKEKRKGGRTFK